MTSADGIDPKVVYQRIRNFLAGQHVGSTRDEALLQEVVKALLCRNWLERDQVPGKTLAARYDTAWKLVKRALPTVYASEDEMRLAPDAIDYLDECFDGMDLHSPEHDVLGDLYEAFLGSSIRGADGQFFT